MSDLTDETKGVRKISRFNPVWAEYTDLCKNITTDLYIRWVHAYLKILGPILDSGSGANCKCCVLDARGGGTARYSVEESANRAIESHGALRVWHPKHRNSGCARR